MATNKIREEEVKTSFAKNSFKTMMRHLSWAT